MSSKVKELQPATKITNAPKPQGTLFVVSSPSGGGKGTIIRHVLDVVPNLSYSVSFTTRAPRNGEVDGREYFFVTPEKFQQMVDAGEFLEWAHVHSKRYGTARQQVALEVFFHQVGQHKRRRVLSALVVKSGLRRIRNFMDLLFDPL